MRSLYPVGVIISIAIAVMMIQMSGLPSILMGGDSVDTIRADDKLESNVQNNSIGAEGAPSSGDDSNFFQFAVGGLGKMVDFALLVLLIPETLATLPLVPWWFAYPLGIVSEGIVLIGIGEAAANRVWN